MTRTLEALQTESVHPSIEGAPFTKDRRQTGGHLGASSDGFRLAYIHRLPAHQLTHIWLDRRGSLQIVFSTYESCHATERLFKKNDCTDADWKGGQMEKDELQADGGSGS